MRTLKKTLCFVLAVVMVLGISAFGVFAESTTEPLSTAEVSEQYKTAAKVAAAMGVFNGGTGDTWSSQLNRAQAATILTRLRGVDASTLTATSNSFTDLDPWAEPYVAYAERAGLILGVGGGRFDPQGALTGYQWGLMLLRVLGYVDSAEGINTDNWQVVTARLARQADLDKEIPDMSKQLTREQAAQMVFNALKADMVEYGTGVTVSTTDGTGINVSGGRKLQTTSNKYGYAIDNKKDGTNDGNGNNNSKYIVQLGEQLYKGDLECLKGDDAFGRPDCETWKNKGKDIVTLAAKNDNLVTTLNGKVEYQDIYDALGSSVVNNDKNGDNFTRFDAWVDGVNVDTKYEKGAESLVNFYTLNVAKGNGTKVLGTGRGTVTELYRKYEDNHYNVTVVVINSYVASATSDYNSSKGTLSITTEGNVPGTLDSRTLDGDDITGLDQFMAKDYLIYTAAKVGNKYEVKTVYAPTKLEGVNVTAFATKNGAADTVTVDGTKYNYAMNDVNDNASYVELKTSYETSSDSTYDFYLDKFNNVIFAEGHSGGGHYVYVKSTNLKQGLDSDSEARIIGVDGKKSDVLIKRVNGWKMDDWYDLQGADTYDEKQLALADLAGHWYRYTLDDGDYRLWSVYINASGGDNNMADAQAHYDLDNDVFASFEKGKGSVKADVTSYTYNDVEMSVGLNSATTFIVDDGDGIRVYPGISTLPNIDDAWFAAVVKDNNYVSYMYIRADSGNIEDTTNLKWAFIHRATVTKGYDSANKVDTYTYDAIVDGVDTTITLNDEVAGPGLYYWSTTKYDRPNSVKSAYYDENSRFTVIDTNSNFFYWYVTTDGNTLSVPLMEDAAYVVNSDAKVWTVGAGGGDATLNTLRGAVEGEYDQGFIGQIYLVNKSDSDKTKSEVYFIGDKVGDEENNLVVDLNKRDVGTYHYIYYPILASNDPEDFVETEDLATLIQFYLMVKENATVEREGNKNDGYSFYVADGNGTVYEWGLGRAEDE